MSEEKWAWSAALHHALYRVYELCSFADCRMHIAGCSSLVSLVPSEEEQVKKRQEAWEKSGQCLPLVYQVTARVRECFHPPERETVP